jgi:hypothetical protein
MKTLIWLRTVGVPLLLIVVLLTFVGVGTVQAATTAIPARQIQSWRIVSSANPASSDVLNSVAAFSNHDVWAVGQGPGPLVEHWNGTSWRVVPNPLSGSGNTLNAVTTIPGTHEVWAVGSQVIELWNGARWKSVVSPGLSSFVLSGVVALSATDAWAVGDGALIVHWNGKTWSQVPAVHPTGDPYTYLYSVTAFSATNVWAVGSASNMAASHTLIEHWNGKKWSIVPSPDANPNSNVLLSVTSIPHTNHLWAVGYSGSQNLVEYWNGSVWSLVSTPFVGIGVVSPLNGSGIVALSAKSAWIVGSYTYGQGDEETLVEHWNGSAWNLVSSPNPAKISFLSGLVKVPGSDTLWAVGGYYNRQEQTLTERYR